MDLDLNTNVHPGIVLCWTLFDQERSGVRSRDISMINLNLYWM